MIVMRALGIEALCFFAVVFPRLETIFVALVNSLLAIVEHVLPITAPRG